MDRDQGSVQESVLLLRQGVATSGNGSCDSTVKGRSAHKVERGSVVPDVQRQKGKPAVAMRTTNFVWVVQQLNGLIPAGRMAQ
jgi:hypothetical protein